MKNEKKCTIHVYILKIYFDLTKFPDILGDQRGAAGLDSSMFSHLKRNWSWVSRGLTKGSLTKKDNLEEDIADPPAAKKAKFSVSNDLVKKKGAKRKLPDDEEDDVETRYDFWN